MQEWEEYPMSRVSIGNIMVRRGRAGAKGGVITSPETGFTRAKLIFIY
jgi:hypothetical protein